MYGFVEGKILQHFGWLNFLLREVLMRSETFTISEMTEKEIENVAIQWAKEEGWNPGLGDAECFYAQNPHGFFIGRLNGEPIGCCSAAIYDEHFAFFGFYIVKREFRHHGYGMEMTKHRLNYVGNRNIGLDGVLNMCDKYENIGFRTAHLNIRYQGQVSLKEELDSHLVLISEELRPLVDDYDRLYFPAPRKSFLNCWLKLSSHRFPLAYLEDGKVKGYGVIRQCSKGYKIGPLFADTDDIAEKIFKQLVYHAQGEVFFLDIPEPNASALKLAESYKMKPCFKALRMYTKEVPPINLNHVFGITTFELG
jgi:hypothetical protein